LFSAVSNLRKCVKTVEANRARKGHVAYLAGLPEGGVVLLVGRVRLAGVPCLAFLQHNPVFQGLQVYRNSNGQLSGFRNRSRLMLVTMHGKGQLHPALFSSSGVPVGIEMGQDDSKIPTTAKGLASGRPLAANSGTNHFRLLSGKVCSRSGLH
jgi:hypothetical protein